MDIIISNSSGKPIYEQITAQIKGQILSGELQAGDALPSMRVLAKELRISAPMRSWSMTVSSRPSREKAALWPGRTPSSCGRMRCGAWNRRWKTPWTSPATAVSRTTRCGRHCRFY